MVAVLLCSIQNNMVYVECSNLVSTGVLLLFQITYITVLLVVGLEDPLMYI